MKKSSCHHDLAVGDAVQLGGDRRAQHSQAGGRARRRRRSGWSCIRHLTCKAGLGVTLLESRASAAAFESSRAYLYLVDTRGQKWTDANNLAPAHRERGVSNDGYQITLAFPTRRAPWPTPILAQEATAKAVWIPRASCSSWRKARRTPASSCVPRSPSSRRRPTAAAARRPQPLAASNLRRGCCSVATVSTRASARRCRSGAATTRTSPSACRRRARGSSIGCCWCRRRLRSRT